MRDVDYVVVEDGKERFFCQSKEDAEYWQRWEKRQMPNKEIRIKTRNCNSKKKWSEEELKELRESYEPTKDWLLSCAFKMGRSVNAIKNKAVELGLTRDLREKRKYQWSQDEVSLIKEMSRDGETVNSILKALNKLNREQGTGITRFRGQLLRKLHRLGLEPIYIDGDRWITLTQLTEGLRCDVSCIHRWFRIYKDVLKPKRFQATGSPLGVSVINFKKFAKEYPGELARFPKADLLWLLTVLLGG